MLTMGRLCRNVYSADGTLLVPQFTKLTDDVNVLLRKHSITLSKDDLLVPHDTTWKKYHIDRTVNELKEIFAEAKQNDRIVIDDVRKYIVPAVESVTQEVHVGEWLDVLYAKDDYTYRHNIAVAILSVKLAGWLRLDEEQLQRLAVCSVLHDIGKACIPDSILNKPGALTSEEYRLMKQHTVLGYELLLRSGMDECDALVCLQHHEREDGSGYPYGIRGTDIHLFSKIVAVTDVFHAMISKRVYKQPSSLYEVLSAIQRLSFNALHPEIAGSFMQRLMESFIGNTVLLSDGRTGNIVMIHPHDAIRPVVRVGNEYIDLVAAAGPQIDAVLPAISC